LLIASVFFQVYCDPRDLHSFPTRRSSDLSPARAASMAAFRASRLVCSAMPVITLITVSILVLLRLMLVIEALMRAMAWVLLRDWASAWLASSRIFWARPLDSTRSPAMAFRVRLICWNAESCWATPALMVWLALAVSAELSLREADAVTRVSALSRAWATTEPNRSEASADWRARASAFCISWRFISMVVARSRAANQLATAMIRVGSMKPDTRSTRWACSDISKRGISDPVEFWYISSARIPRPPRVTSIPVSMLA